MKTQENMARSKQQNKHANIPEEDWTSDTLDNNFDTTILIMYKELKRTPTKN